MVEVFRFLSPNLLVCNVWSGYQGDWIVDIGTKCLVQLPQKDDKATPVVVWPDGSTPHHLDHWLGGRMVGLFLSKCLLVGSRVRSA